MTETEPTLARDTTELLIALLRAFLLETGQGLELAEISRASRLSEDLGLDSLSRAELLSRIENECGINVDVERFLQASTVADLVSIVRSSPAKTPIRSEPGLTEGTPSAPVGEATLCLRTAADFSTLNEVLTLRARESPEQTHVLCIDEQGRPDPFSYGALYSGAQSVAAALLFRGLRTGDAVALILPTGKEFLQCFFGILFAGGVPVPLYPPVGYDKLDEHLRRQAEILKVSGAPYLISMNELLPLNTIACGLVPTLREILPANELIGFAHQGLTPFRPDANSTAFIQFTSGSTGSPKGVVLSHANLLANIQAMGQAIEIRPADRFVSWLPLYHDMGLIGAWLGSLTFGIELVLMSPLSFLTRPTRWLKAISEFKGTLSAAPNFAYQICTERISNDELLDINLSSWRLAFNGAEPVSAHTLRSFSSRFASAGFQWSAFAPVYGLAENSVGLCFPPPGRGPLIVNAKRSVLQSEKRFAETTPDDPDLQQLISCGRPIPQHQVRIVSGSAELADSKIGLLQFKGPSATAGYFHNPEATAQLLDGEWLNTGDFALRMAGEIFITGRKKDLIIVGGRNIFPQDIEEQVSRITGLRRGCVAAFASTNPRTGTEDLVVAAETKSGVEHAALKTSIRERALSVANISPDQIVLLAPKSIPKTSSGKIRRSECRLRYESGTLGQRSRVSLQLLRLLLTALPLRFAHFVRLCLKTLYGVYAALVYIVISIITVVVLYPLPDLGVRRAMLQRLARAVFRLWFVQFRVEGQEHIRELSQGIVVSNHASYLDAIVLTAALPPIFTFVAKKELARHPLMRRLLALNGTRYVDRFDLRESIGNTRDLTTLAEKGESLVFFPEGTFLISRGLMPFKLGAFLIAAQAGIPVIPVTITGTRDALPASRLLLQRRSITVQISAPIASQAPKGNSAFDTARKLRDSARAAILSHLNEPDLG